VSVKGIVGITVGRVTDRVVTVIEIVVKKNIIETVNEKREDNGINHAVEAEIKKAKNNNYVSLKTRTLHKHQ
jgi:hypothetical protein